MADELRMALAELRRMGEVAQDPRFPRLAGLIDDAEAAVLVSLPSSGARLGSGRVRLER